jgi:hypothetical protein
MKPLNQKKDSVDDIVGMATRNASSLMKTIVSQLSEILSERLKSKGQKLPGIYSFDNGLAIPKVQNG